MHSPAKSPILDVTETLSISNSDLEMSVEVESPNNNNNNNKVYPFNASPSTIRLPGLSFPTLVSAKTSSTLPAFEYIAPASNHSMPSLDFPLIELNRMGVGMFPGFMHRRVRGEKRPIPDAQKDEKYYERRKRNNEAAKKSRDARKIREDRIAFRAALLEQENSILRAQILALRDELQTVRQLLGATTAGGMLGMARQL
ncbi:thyrotroph embryonic factor [Drosophila tropicalis]|uniref:thyrotroph embryonic factor n=1 Tax=Drosophila tropicalis TaxID=46794 RepID=UPI0035ABB498